jgi:hypothetical protein
MIFGNLGKKKKMTPHETMILVFCIIAITLAALVGILSS